MWPAPLPSVLPTAGRRRAVAACGRREEGHLRVWTCPHSHPHAEWKGYEEYQQDQQDSKKPSIHHSQSIQQMAIGQESSVLSSSGLTARPTMGRWPANLTRLAV